MYLPCRASCLHQAVRRRKNILPLNLPGLNYPKKLCSAILYIIDTAVNIFNTEQPRQNKGGLVCKPDKSISIDTFAMICLY
jgi:hypothetical protein